MRYQYTMNRFDNYMAHRHWTIFFFNFLDFCYARKPLKIILDMFINLFFLVGKLIHIYWLHFFVVFSLLCFFLSSLPIFYSFFAPNENVKRNILTRRTCITLRKKKLRLILCDIYILFVSFYVKLFFIDLSNGSMFYSHSFFTVWFYKITKIKI